uniref:Toprim domain-containing protein n=1 Tax=Roseihalotalea indica TaxID=2867963 RepID=A0AA49JIC7_9BACT|nr:toprim domain-containing protein [Tunicatimonas sp. TK19036]
MAYNLDFARFKQDINLTQYAAFMGYEIDKKKSTRRSVAMWKDNADKIIISKKNGIWVYFSVFDDADKGSILDFAHHRTGKSLYDIGLELQSWLDGYVPVCDMKPYIREIDEHAPDPKRIERLFNACAPATGHAYLESRGIAEEVLRSPRFEDCIFQDAHKNAVFPHFKDGKVSALELKSERISVFVRGSEKTLWCSNIQPHDDTMIIAEAAIDALSYYRLYELKNAFYIATSGGFSPLQAENVASMLTSVSTLRNVVTITDHNDGGDKLAERLKTVITETGFNGILTRHSPEVTGADWNDVLKTELRM